MLGVVEAIDKSPADWSLKVTTGKKIKGFLGAIIQESPLADHPVSYNLERVFCKKGKLIPSKLQIL